MERVLKKFGTDMPTRRVLLMLRLRGGERLGPVAAHHHQDVTTLTRIVQRMRDEGLVETHNHEDARVTTC